MNIDHVIDSMQYHILQIESHYDSAYDLERNMFLYKSSPSMNVFLWMFYKKQFPLDFYEEIEDGEIEDDNEIEE